MKIPKIIQQLASAWNRFVPTGRTSTSIRQITEAIELQSLREHQLTDLMCLTGLPRQKVKAVAKYYALSYAELQGFYLFFGMLPTRDHATIIRHFGVDYLIDASNRCVVSLKENCNT